MITNHTTEHAEGICEDCVMPMAQQETLVRHTDGSATLMCVKCPFCGQIVNAHMTKTTISCPSCFAEKTIE